MTSKLEEAAKARLRAAENRAWEDISTPEQVHELEGVRALLQELREPGDAMTNVFGLDHPMAKKALWQAGIDAILQEGE